MPPPGLCVLPHEHEQRRIVRASNSGDYEYAIERAAFDPEGNRPRWEFLYTISRFEASSILMRIWGDEARRLQEALSGKQRLLFALNSPEYIQQGRDEVGAQVTQLGIDLSEAEDNTEICRKMGVG